MTDENQRMGLIKKIAEESGAEAHESELAPEGLKRLTQQAELPQGEIVTDNNVQSEQHDGRTISTLPDVATDYPKRCLLLDNKFYDGIEFKLILENGKPRPHWRCHKEAGHKERGDPFCSTHNDCGAMAAGGNVCGWHPGHDGLHAWESAVVPVGIVFLEPPASSRGRL